MSVEAHLAYFTVSLSEQVDLKNLETEINKERKKEGRKEKKKKKKKTKKKKKKIAWNCNILPFSN